MSKNKNNKKSFYLMCIVLAWLLFVLLTLVFVFYFLDDLPMKNGSTEEKTTLTEVTQSQKETVYQINSDIKINSLMSEYYSALLLCDQDKLKTLVTEPSQFDDMTAYEKRALAVKNYANINCYVVPGVNEGEYVVYTTCNIDIVNVESKPLDITQFYVKKTDNGYIIDNSSKDKSVQDYITEKTNSEDIQDLYEAVKANVDQCVANDPSFADFYNSLMQ